MNNVTKPNKRIVSKGKFAASVAKKMTLSGVGAAISFLGIVALVPCVLVIQWMIAEEKDWISILGLLVMGVALICFPLVLVYFGVTAVKKAKQIDLGVPYTRTNTANLPAPDSLVRASSLPAQAQESVLLRASGEAQDIREEQLLRASAGD